MIDFDKLNAMINEVNNVIIDVKKDTEQTKKEGDNIKKAMWANAHCKIANMYKTYQNAIENVIENDGNENPFAKKDLKIDINIGNGIIRFDSCGISLGTYSYIKQKWDFCYIRDSYRIDDYKDYNHSHPSIIYFHNVALMWNDVKEDIESQFINGIYLILKQRSENAHKENVEAHEFLNSFSNSI